MINGSLTVAELVDDAASSQGRSALLPVGDGYYMARFSEAPRWRIGLKLHAWLARHPSLYQAVTGAIIPLLHLLGGKRGICP